MSLHWQLPPTLHLSFCQSRRAQTLKKNKAYLCWQQLTNTHAASEIILSYNPLSMRTTWGPNSHNDRTKCALSGAAVTPEEEQSQFYTQSSVKRITSPIPLTFVLSNLHAHTHTRMHAHCVLLSHHCNLTSGLLPQDRSRQIHAFTYILWQCAAHITSHPVTLTLPLGSFIYLFNKREGWEEVSVPERKLDRRHLRGRRRLEKRERSRLIWEH